MKFLQKLGKALMLPVAVRSVVSSWVSDTGYVRQLCRVETFMAQPI